MEMKALLIPLLAVFVICLAGLARANVAADGNLTYQRLGPVTASVSFDVHSTKMIVKLRNLKPLTAGYLNEIVPYHKGFLFHSATEAVYAEGFSPDELEREVRESKFSKRSFVLSLLVPRALAADEKCIVKSNEIETFSRINHGLKLADLTKMIGKCDFSISKIIERQVNTATEIGATIKGAFTGELWNKISETIKVTREMIPAIYDKLVVPLGELLATVPALAQALVCEFAENKVGQIAMTVFAGGLGLPAALAKTSAEIAELLKKVSVLSKSTKALRMVQELQKHGRLDEKTVERIFRLENDVPSSHKALNVKFRTDENMLKHFEKHKDELGFRTPEEYQAGAQKLVKKNGDTNTVVYPLPNGDFNKVDLATGEMVVTNKYGNIITYFKLGCKAEHEKLLFMLYSKEASQMGICRDH